MEERLANEIIDAANGTGAAVKNAKIHIEWQKRTKHLLIINGNLFKFRKELSVNAS